MSVAWALLDGSKGTIIMLKQTKTAMKDGITPHYRHIGCLSTSKPPFHCWAHNHYIWYNKLAGTHTPYSIS